jgi:metallophosphoesterase (TIGR00282 family)
MSTYRELLFFGDLVGSSGRRAVLAYLDALERKPDLVVANVENATHGFGISEKHYQELLAGGVDVMTGGNHIFDRREFADWIGGAERLVRPANFVSGTPGEGAKVFDIRGLKIGVLNLIGQAFMGNYNSPWEQLEQWVPRLLNETPVVFVDIHAESTAEKICLARRAAELGVSAMVGTHTHVQTADERLIHHRMGYLTDAGFNGAYESVIGMEPYSSMARMRGPSPVRMEVSESDCVQINAVRFRLDFATGECLVVERVHHVMNLS